MELLKIQYEKRQELRGKHGRLRHVPLVEGDLVLQHKNDTDLQDAGKMGVFWDGPFKVHKVLGNGAYKLELSNGKIEAIATAGRQLKKFYEHEQN